MYLEEGGGVPQHQWKYAIIIVLDTQKSIGLGSATTRGISQVAHAGKILPKIIARRFGEFCERVGMLSE